MSEERVPSPSQCACGFRLHREYCPLFAGQVSSRNPGCTDARSEGWSCIESDGTGLWCDSCLSVEGRPTP